MNEELEKVDATVREPPKAENPKPQKVKTPITHRLWAKILAFVLLGLFLMIAAVGVYEACISSYYSYRFDTAEDFAEFMQNPYHAFMSDATGAFEHDFLVLVFNVSNWWLGFVLVGAVGAISCLAFLFAAAGHKAGREGVSLNLLDRIPLDLYLFCSAVLAVCILWIVFGVFPYSGFWDEINSFTPTFLSIIFLLGLFLYIAFVIVLAPFLSFATRIKVGGDIWWRNTVIYRALRLCWRIVKWCWSLVKRFCGWVWYMTKKIPIVPRTAIIVAAVLLFNIILNFWNTNVQGDAFVEFLLFILSLVIFVAACFGAWQMKTLKAAGERMAKGEIDEKIDTKYMYWEFKHHADNLNSIGDGMAAAVEQRMKSERLKTELITNVSHDIKTPLTSIVNYVDLLQKPHTPEQEGEYLEVLDRQSKRLKKLTEDLVEASKASTGNMNVELTPTNTREIIEQSLAEYGKRMEQGNLSVVTNISEPPPRATADGRLLWRVLDNLFNNVVKYAMPGTRVYINSDTVDGFAVISVKNISRDPLNISAEELMERFVRGDSSRHTEGSGLGLNIARSLVELMHGKFSISVDGDLFKAEIRLPEAK